MLINEVGQSSQLDHCFPVGSIYVAPTIMLVSVRVKIQWKAFHSLHNEEAVCVYISNTISS
jgi:hypothetical protein